MLRNKRLTFVNTSRLLKYLHCFLTRRQSSNGNNTHDRFTHIVIWPGLVCTYYTYVYDETYNTFVRYSTNQGKPIRAGNQRSGHFVVIEGIQPTCRSVFPHMNYKSRLWEIKNAGSCRPKHECLQKIEILLGRDDQ